ncbi:MAG: hypothetical protein IKQ49_03470, partial [Eubacterium sp.]|nr:hypothetical protein [Eubacterium sp.]
MMVQGCGAFLLPVRQCVLSQFNTIATPKNSFQNYFSDENPFLNSNYRIVKSLAIERSRDYKLLYESLILAQDKRW